MLRAEEGQAPPPLAAQVRRGHPARLACPPGVGKPRAGELPLGGAWGRSPRMGLSDVPAPSRRCRPPAGPPDPVARPLPGSSRRGRPSLPGLARVPPAHTHRDTEATILRGGRSGCGLLGLHRATAATSGNRGEEAPAANAGPGRGPGGGDPLGLTGPHPPAARCPSGTRFSRASTPASSAACAAARATEDRPLEECSPGREGQVSFIHQRYPWIPRGGHR